MSVILTPINMVEASKDYIQAPSRILDDITITKAQFDIIARFPKLVMVSFEEDDISNPIKRMSYIAGYGSKGSCQRYIIKLSSQRQ